MALKHRKCHISLLQRSMNLDCSHELINIPWDALPSQYQLEMKVYRWSPTKNTLLLVVTGTATLTLTVHFFPTTEIWIGEQTTGNQNPAFKPPTNQPKNTGPWPHLPFDQQLWSAWNEIPGAWSKTKETHGFNQQEGQFGSSVRITNMISIVIIIIIIMVIVIVSIPL